MMTIMDELVINRSFQPLAFGQLPNPNAAAARSIIR